MQGTGTNGNGATFTGNNYYTIAGISGSTLTLKTGQTLTAQTGASVSLSLVTPTPAGTGNNIIIGGVGADTIDVGGANNTVIGDDGQAKYDATTGKLTSITTLDPSFGGSDIINVTGGDNAILGGFGADQITIGGGGNVVLGDNGFAQFTAAGTLTLIATTDQTYGSDDSIVITGSGNNTIFGGSGADLITVNGNGNNVIFGDNGVATFDPTTGNLTEAETIGEIAPANGSMGSVESGNGGTIYGGDDTITVGAGNNVIVGGFGADQITTGAGNAIVLGDSGSATFNATTGDLIDIFSTYGSAVPNSGNPDDGTSSNDTITLGNGNNVVIGGGGADQIIVGQTGANVIIGDDGRADYTNGVLTDIFSTDDTIGGNDTISGPGGTPGGSGYNVAIGGIGGDTITLGGANNTIIGDDGRATFGTSGQILTITTQDPGFGGNDIITVTGGDNVIFGGTGADTITVQTAQGQSAPSGNVIIGDDGNATFTSEPVSNTVATSVLTFIETTNQTDGGDDIITTGDGNNVILGGYGADQITVGNGNNVILGDNGEATFVVALASGAVATGNAAYSRALTQIETTAEELNGTETADSTAGGTVYGGDDRIIAGAGNNVILGGLGADQITAGNGNNIVLGDSGTANFDQSTGNLISIFSTFVGVPVGHTTDTGTSSDDTIRVGLGTNIIFGGSGADTITADYLNAGPVSASNAISDIILGDDGEADFINGVVSLVISTHTNDGGDDTINAGNGNDIVFGGLGADGITLGDGKDTVVGDSGEAQFSSTGIVQIVFDIAPNAVLGGTPDTGTSSNDTIVVGNGNDFVIGGSGADQITAGNGNDYILGDNGIVEFTVVAGVNMATRAETSDGLYGGNDTIIAGNGVDSIIGGDGSDVITVGNGSDDIVLGDNGEIVQAFNSDGSLELNSDGNPHRDVVLEEIGTITGAIAIDSASDAASATAAAITTANLILLAGEFNADGSQVTSQTSGAWETEALLLSLVPDGNDNITVGSGNDVIIGQGGNNTITANGGNDIIFGNGASNTAPVVSDIPSIVNAVVIVAAPGDSQIVLPSSGQIVVPTVNLEPSALTTNTPQLEMAPPGFGILGNLAEGGTLSLGGGVQLTVFASVVPSLLNGSPVLPGSNIINGGSGNDTIFGNYGQIAALPTTGITQIDNQLQGLSVTMLGLLNELSALSTVQDGINPISPYAISAENNTITVGDGNDTIFGNDGEYLVPGVAFAEGAGSLTSNAVALDTYLLEMQELFGDMSFAVNESGARVISSYSGPSSHLLDIGNSTIVDGNGSDLVIGATGIVIMPGDGTPTSNWATGASSGTLQSVQQQLQSLESGYDSKLANQFAADHPFTATDGAAAQFGTGFNLYIGNNQISGGAGNSILIGDDALMLDPVIGGGANGAADAAELQSIMVTAVDRLFLGGYSAPTAMAESWGVTTDLAASGATDWSSGGGYVFNDPSKSDIQIDDNTISTGSGSDHVYGGLAVLLPQLGSSTGLVTGFYAYPSGFTGSNASANFSYVYGFGPFGSLHQWAADATSPSRYAVDANTITGGAGNNFLFGGLGDDSITGGSGNDQIDGGYGFNTLSGGGGVNEIAFNRATDTHVQGSGDDIAQSSLDLAASSPFLQVGWQSVVGTELAAGMLASPGTPVYVVTPPPVVTTSNLTEPAGLALAASSLFSVSDPNGNPITEYQFWDSNTSPNTGHFYLNGVEQPLGTVLTISASQLSELTFVTGTAAAAIQVRAFDGTVWSAPDTAAWAPIAISVGNNALSQPPVVTTTNLTETPNQPLAASSLFSVTDPGGNAITEYQFWDSNTSPNTGHFYLNGVEQPLSTILTISASQLSQMTFVTGTASSAIQLRAFDGTLWSAADNAAWAPFSINVGSIALPQPPVVTTANLTEAPNQTLAASSLFSVNDPGGNAITEYQFWDSNTSPNAGHFYLNGVEQSLSTVIDISASQLAQMTFVTGTAASAIQVRAFDGVSWSAADNGAWAPFVINVSVPPPPVVTTSTVSELANQTLAASSLFSVTDPAGNSITEYQFWDSNTSSNTGHFYLNGVQQALGTVIDISASQLSQMTFVTGTALSAIQVRAFDGTSWSASDTGAWAPFSIDISSSTQAPVSIAAGGLIELIGPSAQTITFAGSTGTLELQELKRVYRPGVRNHRTGCAGPARHSFRRRHNGALLRFCLRRNSHSLRRGPYCQHHARRQLPDLRVEICRPMRAAARLSSTRPWAARYR